MNRAEIFSLWPEARAAIDRAVEWPRRWLRINWKRSLVILHFAKMLYWFRDVSPFSAFPIANVDYIQFYGRVLRIHEFLERSGRIWGYDPFDMAGYLSGPFLEVGTHLLALVAHFLEFIIPISVTTLIVEVVALVAIPFIVFPIMRLFDANRRTAWIAFGVVVFTFGVSEPFSAGMCKIGLWGFMLSGFFSIFQVALFYRWIERPSLKLWAGMTVASALLFQIHPAAVVLIIAPWVTLYLMNFRRLGWRGHAALGATALVVLVANWYWVSPFLAFSQWRVTAPYYTTLGFRDIFNRFGPIQMEVFPEMQAILNVSSIILALIAIRKISVKRPMLAHMFLIWIIFLFIVSYFGSWIPWVSTLQPGRNEFLMFLLLSLLSATVFDSHVLALKRPRCVAGILAVFLLAYMFEKGPGYLPWAKNVTAFRTDVTDWQNALIQYLRTRPPGEGRVLLECTDDLNPNFADIVPALTGQVLLGGQHPGNFLATRSTIFSGHFVVNQYEASSTPTGFDHDLSLISEQEFSDYLALYNVTLVAARTPLMVNALARMTNTLEIIDVVPPHNVYRVIKPSTWFSAGEGRISFDFDKITIDDASTGLLIPKVHWFDTFQSEPPVPIRPVFLMDDPVPFLSIDNNAGHKHIEIYNPGLPSISQQLRNKLAHKRSW